MGNQNQDEVFLAASEAVGANRDAQGRIYNPLIANFVGAICKKRFGRYGFDEAVKHEKLFAICFWRSTFCVFAICGKIF